MNQEDIFKALESVPDELLAKLQFSTPWQYDSSDSSDSDNFTNNVTGSQYYTRTVLQDACWDKFHKNPQMNTAVRGQIGRLTGMGFKASSDIFQIQEALDEITYDHRNRLYNYWPKYVGRSIIEGELFLLLTCHTDGFIEVDFIDPSVVNHQGDDESGIIYHPTKLMPLFYNITDDAGAFIAQIPSVYVARYPELVNTVREHKDFNLEMQVKSRITNRKFSKIGGFNQFIVAWDKGFLTRRAVSHLRTTLEWLNYYENLKKYEIDHKKSSGSYLWVFKFTDAKAFKLWLSMGDDDKRKTGIMAKKVPGGSLVLPPGIEVVCLNPNLTSIREQDTDILHMVTAGLNEPEDISTGKSGGSYASVKASRGPMADRIADEIAYFKRFLIYDFWSNVFFLKSSISTFPTMFKVREAVGFDKQQEPIFKNIPRRPEQLIDMSFPTSDSIEYADRASALLGVKHANISDTLGIPLSEVATKLGFGGYGKLRRDKATEDEKYPRLIMTLDAESIQEQNEAEPSLNTIKKRQANKNDKDSKKQNDSKDDE